MMEGKKKKKKVNRSRRNRWIGLAVVIFIVLIFGCLWLADSYMTFESQFGREKFEMTGTSVVLTNDAATRQAIMTSTALP